MAKNIYAPLVGAYYGAEMALAEAEGRICRVEIDPALPVDTAWDLGIADATSIWAFQVLPSEIRIVGHYENHGWRCRIMFKN
jgi:phage terminase large subunit